MDKTQYRLKKDTYDLKAGAIFEWDSIRRMYYTNQIAWATVEQVADTEWFELIPQPIEDVHVHNGLPVCEKCREIISSQPTEEQCKHERLEKLYGASWRCVKCEKTREEIDSQPLPEEKSEECKHELYQEYESGVKRCDDCNEVLNPHSIQEIAELTIGDFSSCEDIRHKVTGEYGVMLTEEGARKLIKAVNSLLQKGRD